MPALKTITQEVLFKASPEEVYVALMDSERHSAFTGSIASISVKIDGPISAYGGYITGSNIKLVPGKLIVQRWRVEGWPREHYSTITIGLKKAARKTVLSFTQTGVPNEFYRDIANGWKKFYWEKMKTIFNW